ncbi:MAG: hypothetical protein ACM3XM_21225 [Mycobacterium leprae]
MAEASRLLAFEQGTEARARIQAAVCRSCLELTDYFAAAEAGEAAVRLAEEAQAFDVAGLALLDLATAESRIRRYESALLHFARYFDGLSTYTAARCMEGTALQRMGDTLTRAGRHAEALERYGAARRWYERFGAEQCVLECARAMIRIHLDRGEPGEAVSLLGECSRYAAAHQGDRAFGADHLLDRAYYLFAMRRHAESVQAASGALELADDRLAQQSEAQLLLCRNALSQNKREEALSFALAARVCAIDGRLYELEFEASELLFRLLREGGIELLQALEPDFAAAGVNLFQYLPERLL